MSGSLSLIMFAVLCGVGGQLSLKAGMNQVGRIDSQALVQPFQVVARVLASPMVIGGLGLYVLGAVAWLTVLSRLPLSLAYPLVALTYVFTPVLAWLILGESVPTTRWLGIATICLGIFLVSRS